MDRNADLLVVPWAAGASHHNSHEDLAVTPRMETIFGHAAVEASPMYASFVRRLFMESSTDVALYLDGGLLSTPLHSSLGAHKHIYFPFHGGPDDRAALDLVMQFVATNHELTATITRFVNNKKPSPSPTRGTFEVQLTVGTGISSPDTVYPGPSDRLASDVEDNLALARYFPTAFTDNADSPPLLAHAVSRASFSSVNTSTPIKASLEMLQTLTIASRSVLVVLGRSRRSSAFYHDELEVYLQERATQGQGLKSLGIAASSEVRKTLGVFGSAVVASGQASDVLILQSTARGEA